MAIKLAPYEKVTMPNAKEALQKQAKIIPFQVSHRRERLSAAPAQLPIISLSELYDHVYQNRPPVIDDLLYSGTYIFAGAPKMGKSFFMAQLAYHVSTGTPLWDHPVHPGTVLYLALEDDHQRLQQRMSRMFGVEGTDKLYFAVEAPELENGLEERLDAFIKDHPDTRLIIIDTLQKILGNGSGSTYAKDYLVMSRLKKYADANGICLVIVHHTRKSKDKDIFNMISGSTGLLGSVDGAFVLHKCSRMDDGAVLEVIGRDQPEQQIYLCRDEDTLAWNFDGEMKEAWIEAADPLLEAVNEMLSEDEPQWTGSASELIQRLGLDVKPNALTRKLNVKAGTLLNDYAIRYENIHTRNGSKISLCRVAEETA